MMFGLAPAQSQTFQTQASHAILLDAGAPSVYLHGGMARELSAWLPPPLRERLAGRCGDNDVPLEGAILLARRALESTARAVRSA